MRYRSPLQVDPALLSSLEEIGWGNAVLLSSSPTSSHSSVPSYSDSDDTSMIDGCQAYRLVGGKKAVIAQLESESVAHEAELTIGRGEPVWSWRERIRESVRAEAAKRINGDVTPSPPPNDTGVASSSGGRKVAFDESPDAGYVEVGKKKLRSRKANRLRRDLATGSTTATAPDPVPVTVPESSPPTSMAMYSLVVAAPLPPPVPHMTRPGWQVQSRLV